MTRIEPFALERYFARHEFTAQYLLSSSDCEPLSLSELLDLAGAENRRRWEALGLGYTESPGHPRLRAEIAALYGGLEGGNILVAAPEEAIYLWMHAVLRAGDHVVCTFPGYQSLYAVAQALGCRVDFWQPDEARDWYFDPAALARLVREDTRLVVVNFPHNPTGSLPPAADFQAVVELARASGAYLLSDEMYRYLEHPPAERLPAACELYERAVSLGGLSKSFGLPGLRIGWLASRAKEVLARCQDLKDYTTICSSAPSEILALIALEKRETIVNRQRARVARNLAQMESFAARHANWLQWPRPGGSSVGFARLLGAADSHAFCERLVAETGIMLLPSSQFQYGRNHVRIGYGRENFPQVLAQLEAYLERQPGGNNDRV